jgi:diguanylate cyclase (GGDEF)-like protein/putative nucleotidyltransferase with HDIG domain
MRQPGRESRKGVPETEAALAAPSVGGLHQPRASRESPEARAANARRRDGLEPLGALLSGGTFTAAATAGLSLLSALPRLVSFVLALLGFFQLLALVLLGYYRRKHLRHLQDNLDRARLLAHLNSAVIGSFAMAIDAKDQHTQGHTERVRDIAVMVGEELGLSDDDLEALRMAAMLHDIGKLAVPDYILSKPSQLTQEEMRKVQTHTLVGAALLESVRFPWPVVPIIRSHHEWYDGTGYPDGLAGEQIPLGSRILAAADVYDALLSHRPYRPPMSVPEAVRFMRERSGSQFDPRIIGVCFQVLAARESRLQAGFIIDADGRERAATEETPDRSSLFMNIRQAHQELLALYEIVQTMGQSLDVQETMDLVIGKTKRIIDFSTCVLFLRQPDTGVIVAAAAAGPHADLIKGLRLTAGAGVSGQVAQSGQPSGLGQSAGEDLRVLLGGEARNCSLEHVVAAPLIAEEKTPIGVLTLYRPANRPFSEDDARLAVTVARQAAIAISNAREHEQTRQSAMTDPLTELPNARYFLLRLEQELSRARREQKPLSLIACDLDGLKHINDSFGHPQGDRALQVVSQVFRRHVRDYDTVVRYAGDEFFIILPDTNNKTAVDTTERIKVAVRETTVEMVPGREINLSASLGVATFPGDAEQADALIAVADHAMYVDKRLNRQAALLSAAAGEDDGQGWRAGPR